MSNNLERKLKLWKFVSFSFLILSVVLGVFLSRVYSSKAKIKPFTPSRQVLSQEKKWEFDASDRSGRVLKTKVSLFLVSAEKINQVYIRNKPLRTVSDKTFLVLNLELENKAAERIYFYPSDYFRLVLEGKKLEADFKSSRLEIAPLSNKKDRLVFLVEGKEKNFKIQVGEIAGNLETIEITF